MGTASPVAPQRRRRSVEVTERIQKRSVSTAHLEVLEHRTPQSKSHSPIPTTAGDFFRRFDEDAVV